MQNIARLLLLVFAGLSLAGCSTQTAALKQETPEPRAVTLGDRPLSGRDYWLLRDFDDRSDRVVLAAK